MPSSLCQLLYARFVLLQKSDFGGLSGYIASDELSKCSLLQLEQRDTLELPIHFPFKPMAISNADDGDLWQTVAPKLHLVIAHKGN